MTEEQKPFEYMEILAICMMVATASLLILEKKKFKTKQEGRKMIENEIKNIVAIRWDAPDKKAIK